MFKIIKYLRSGLVVSAITAMSVGLSAGSAYAQEEEDEKEKEKERVVKVDCNKGDDVQEVLDTYGFESKPLVLVIKGSCMSDEEDENYEVEVKRDNVGFRGDEVEGGYLSAFVIEGARDISIEENMVLDTLSIERGQVFLAVEEEDGSITINVAVGLSDQASLDVTTDASGASINIDGPISILNHSLLTVQQNANVGTVEIIGEISASLQSSLKISDASIGNIIIAQDSHAFFVERVTPTGEPSTIECDTQSKVWGTILPGFLEVQGQGYCAGF